MTTLQRGLTREQRQRLWQMWKTGSSITDIGISLSKAPGSVHTYLSHRGGIAPPSRQRAERHLSLAQREEISRGLVLGSSLRSIALLIGVAPSTVTREVKRNGGGSVYRAVTADARASTQACRPKTCKLASHLPLREAVANKLQQDWSPQQVSGWLQKFYGDDSSMQLSHEAIYRSLFIQTRGLLKRELLAHLRSRRMMRRSQAFSTKGRPRGQIIDAVSIHDRPASVEDRAIPGHWEGDLITGSCNSHIATLVERWVFRSNVTSDSGRT